MKTFLPCSSAALTSLGSFPREKVKAKSVTFSLYVIQDELDKFRKEWRQELNQRGPVAVVGGHVKVELPGGMQSEATLEEKVQDAIRLRDAARCN